MELQSTTMIIMKFLNLSVGTKHLVHCTAIICTRPYNITLKAKLSRMLVAIRVLFPLPAKSSVSASSDFRISFTNRRNKRRSIVDTTSDRNVSWPNQRLKVHGGTVVERLECSHGEIEEDGEYAWKCIV